MVCGLLCVLVVADHAMVPAGFMATGVVMVLALLVRRRYPIAVMAVVSLAALAQVVFYASIVSPRPFDVAVEVAMYSVVKYGRRLRDAILAGGAVAIGIGIEVFKSPAQSWVVVVLFYGGFSVAAWLTAFVVRNRQRYLASLEERATSLERERDHLARIAVAEERAEIARELHDVVAHSLAVMIVQADGGRYAFDTDPAQARAALEVVASTGREALADMRRLVGVLRGSGPVGSADPARRRTGLGQIATFADRARSAGLAVEVSLRATDADIPPAVGLTAVRVVQEALTNTLRHAGPGARAQVSLSIDDDTLLVSCLDDGTGPRPGQDGAEGSGHGLLGMRERINVHSGTLSAGRRLEGGWSVVARIPLSGHALVQAPAISGVAA
jgi:signal transduction histidine kinase